MPVSLRTHARRSCLPLTATLLLGIAGCASTNRDNTTAAQAAAADPVPDSAGMTCNAEAAQGDVGQAASPDVVDRIVKATGSANARVIKPGMAVTMDYREDRVNIEVDARNMVTGVKCG